MAELNEIINEPTKKAVNKVFTTTELAKEVADDFAKETVEISRSLTPMQIGIGVGALVAGIAIGGFAGYRFAEKRLATKFETLLAEETEKLRKHYVKKTAAKRTNAKPDLGQVVEDLGYSQQEVPAIDILPAVPSVIMQPEEPTVTQVIIEELNVFDTRDKANTNWDYAVEIKSRNPRIPYVIHLDEWNENPQEFERENLVYYEGDEVLADDDDKVISDIEEAIGFDNLDRFGHGSGDPNVVFIRNEVREIDYEIARSAGMYAHEVHGFDPEQIRDIKHANDSMRGRYRFDDE